MTQMLNRDPADTAVIRYEPYTTGGIVRLWTPRTDQQSPDLRPPTDEYAIVANRLVHEADNAETQAVIDLATPAVVLAEVMPQPQVRPPGYRGRRRMAAPDDLLLPLLALGVVGGLLMIAVQVALLQVAIRVSGAVL
jgi:hypothetical protein